MVSVVQILRKVLRKEF